MKKVFVSEACIGCGACVSIANELFDFDETGYSRPLKEVIESKEDIEKATDAAEACPVSAIEIEDANESEEKAA
ncbi:MAG: ferredoxin [Bacilli bacterium]|nr:ferredoxin [Bacilli bacterium]